MQDNNENENQSSSKFEWTIGNIFKLIRLLWHKFWYLFTYKTYASYVRATNRLNHFFGLAIFFLVVGLFIHRFSAYAVSIFMVWVIYAFVITFRSKGLVKNARILADYFNLKEIPLGIYDLVPFNAQTMTSKVAFTLFPEYSLIGSFFKMAVNKASHRDVSYEKALGRVKEAIRFYRRDPDKKKINAHFYLCLPVDENSKIYPKFAQAISAENLKLIPSNENPKLVYKPSKLAFKINNKEKYPKHWVLFEIQ